MLILAHVGGDDGFVLTSLLAVSIMFGAGLTVMLMDKRGDAGRRKAMIAASALVLSGALVLLPTRLQTCHLWRDRLLTITSTLVSASGQGSDNPPGLTPQEHAQLQTRVAEILKQRPFGCV